MIPVPNRFAGLLFSLLFALSLAPGAHAQLTEHCTVSVLNRTVQVKPDGSWVLPNIPANFGQVRARATCVENGITRAGQSELFSVPANGAVNLPMVQLGAVAAIPAALTVAAPTTTLPTAGATTQLVVTAKFPDGSAKNVTAASAGTNYTNSNVKVATITPDGLVTAVSSGTVIISALHEGALGLIRIQVALSGGDADGDGIPDDIELANGLNPNDPTDGFADPDNDGLTNKQELVDFGTRIDLADTDGDTIADGEEVVAGTDGFVTNPLRADTDGDGVNDGTEVANGSNPTDPSDRGRALVSIEVNPSAFTLTVNTIIGEASRQLKVTGRLKNGGTVDLTSTTQGTNYTSSDLTKCNFGSPDGRVFASADGTCTITATNSGFSATANGTVTTFAPTARTFISIPGFANNVEVNGNFAYVAAGSTGLQVVDVTNRSAPVIVGAVDTPGNANDVVVVGSTAFVADGSAGLRIIDITDPRNPVIVGAVDTPGDAQDVMVKGSRAFVADGASGLQIVDVTNPQTPVLLGSVDTPGSAKGVDAAQDRPLAIVADGSSGIHVVDITDATHPTLIASISIAGDARDVVISGNFAFVADFCGSFTSVDISDPSQPVLKASTDPSLGGKLVDVALAGRFALGADVFFVNGVPIIDVSTPQAPAPRTPLDFRTFRDDDGTGIAVDSSFVYLTAGNKLVTVADCKVPGVENGTNGDTRLYIGQYLDVEDLAEIPPTVDLTAPVSGDTLVEGETFTLRAEATDDIAVASLRFLVNGQVVFTDTAEPFEFRFTVPVGVSSLTFSAEAIDLGNNIGAASEVTITVIPDPLTTVIGMVVDTEGNPVGGVTVSTVGGHSGVTLSDGSFSIPGVSTIVGSIQVRATFTTADGMVLKGASAPVSPIRAGTTDVGQIRLASCLSPPAGLVGWWPGDGNANEVQRGNNGTVQGGVTFAPGEVAQAFNFNGSTGFVTVPDGDLWTFGTNDFTVDLWANFRSVRPSSIGNPASVFISHNEGPGPQNKWNFMFGGGKLNFHINGPTIGALFLAQATFSPALGRWYHLAVTRKGTTFTIYVDGTPVSSEVNTVAIPNPNGPLTIGQTENLGFHDGLIDEVEIFNRALSQSEIQGIFTAGSLSKCKP
jgi:hypothetical protein